MGLFRPAGGRDPGGASGAAGRDAELIALVTTHCAAFGESVVLLLTQRIQAQGHRQVLRTLGLQATPESEANLALLLQWLQAHGTRELFRAISAADTQQKLSVQPLHPPAPGDTQAKARESLARLGMSPVPPAASAPAPPPAAPAAPQHGTPPGAPPPWAKPGDRSVLPPPPPGGFKAPPGYPFPWPSDLRPGPEAPPPTVPPEKLAWPHVERRTGFERRSGKDRRDVLDVVYKNKRFGGDRRKSARRTKWPPKG